MKNTFKEADKSKVISFLNHIAKHGRFEHTVPEAIEFFHLLTYMQKELLPKIDDNTLEVKRVVQTKEDF